ncbi:uncharacterized protein K452DRAFT_360951 [Aplosporella prunicola CBS 121167]|uniref:Uncharacterized protein n=1 Tax=Aplosporella prunicola CBS 121167 TaxID=1176127 RepID=A0A6A6B5L2_9PEZI|nr:uncharacterized protein K452DRAFT_360951 [Aplosporella prunicola CBS 121167]KAF2138713.1 hypothetical protein K452DRAFT_360951 [Aplosporella prunicola CBS 121167]
MDESKRWAGRTVALLAWICAVSPRPAYAAAVPAWKSVAEATNASGREHMARAGVSARRRRSAAASTPDLPRRDSLPLQDQNEAATGFAPLHLRHLLQYANAPSLRLHCFTSPRIEGSEACGRLLLAHQHRLAKPRKPLAWGRMDSLIAPALTYAYGAPPSSTVSPFSTPAKKPK